MKNYFAPEVEILDVMVEQGFAASGDEPIPGLNNPLKPDVPEGF